MGPVPFPLLYLSPCFSFVLGHSGAVTFSSEDACQKTFALGLQVFPTHFV